MQGCPLQLVIFTPAASIAAADLLQQLCEGATTCTVLDRHSAGLGRLGCGTDHQSCNSSYENLRDPY